MTAIPQRTDVDPAKNNEVEERQSVFASMNSAIIRNNIDAHSIALLRCMIAVTVLLTSLPSSSAPLKIIQWTLVRFSRTAYMHLRSRQSRTVDHGSSRRSLSIGSMLASLVGSLRLPTRWGTLYINVSFIRFLSRHLTGASAKASKSHSLPFLSR